MIKLNIKGQDIKVPPLSALSFKDFNRIVLKAKCADLEGYLSLYCDVPLAELRASELGSSDSLRGLHRRIFDLDPEATVSSPKKSLFFKGVWMAIGDLSYRTFCHGYFYDMYLIMHERGEINKAELSVYSLAIALAPEASADIGAVEALYGELSALPWKDVLPQAFFLQKKSMPRSLRTFFWCRAFIQGLKARAALIRLQAGRLGKRERKILSSAFASYFARRWSRSSKWT